MTGRRCSHYTCNAQPQTLPTSNPEKLGSLFMIEQLQASAFVGDPDVDELHTFFLPDRQFGGDTRWTFGTSLKAAYVNTFEFMNHAPVVQLWRDQDAALQVVSRLSLGTGEWFHLAAPSFRTSDVTAAVQQQADQAFALLTDRAYWETVRYESKVDEIHELEQAGYVSNGAAEVFMTRSLEQPIDDAPCPAGVTIRLLDPTDAALVHERAMAQIDAFSVEAPTAAEEAWITRSLPHQISYGRPDVSPHVIAVNETGGVVAFADIFCDVTNAIGEFEPVGTRTSSQRTGLSKAVLHQGLQEMQNRGMRQAVVRTGSNNTAAIAAYESVGFTTTDHLIRLRQQRSR